MDLEYDEQEDYYGKCGELFLTVAGNIAFHCTLCDNIYKHFQEYNDHVMDSHYAPFKEELSYSINDEGNSFDPLSADDYSVNSESLIGNEDEETETVVEPEEVVPPSCEDMSQNNSTASNELPNTEDIVPTHSTKKEAIYSFDELSDDCSVIYEEFVGNEDDEAEIYVKPEDIVPSTCEDLPRSNLTMSNNLPNPKLAIKLKLGPGNFNPEITDRQFKCPLCDFSCNDKWNIKRHTRRHSMDKPHQCMECLKSFHTRTELTVHLRIHTGERPYLCTFCGMSFITSGKLSSHQKRHSNVRNKECPKCELRFHDLRSLRRHIVVHSDKRNYKCEHCDASFKLPNGLKAHMKLHENKREYQCKLCDSGFNQRAGLYSHMKSSHTVIKGSIKYE